MDKCICYLLSYHILTTTTTTIECWNIRWVYNKHGHIALDNPFLTALHAEV
jgi:hypothetical protein